jgi:hypothetical protein
MRLKLSHKGHLQRHDPPAEFRENLTSGSKFISKRDTDGKVDRQTDDIISPFLSLDASTLTRNFHEMWLVRNRANATIHGRSYTDCEYRPSWNLVSHNEVYDTLVLSVLSLSVCTGSPA